MESRLSALHTRQSDFDEKIKMVSFTIEEKLEMFKFIADAKMHFSWLCAFIKGSAPYVIAMLTFVGAAMAFIVFIFVKSGHSWGLW